MILRNSYRKKVADFIYFVMLESRVPIRVVV